MTSTRPDGLTDEVTPIELAALLAKGTGERIELDRLTDELTFDELGVDSLALLGVITVLERDRGVVLPDDAQQITAVREFLGVVNSALAKVV
ncbi:acyl carrier protein [Actinokineospora sp. NBRC 105648]|uniref:acyl carrier protein n=1 Tax=Actinokineospora sp. NBRC 105648 TaxID=3032206 RepID=UPI0024A34592|nr:acyl carrier protein [Actinokineospora sp. NBRC 105648]GLZ42031.1 hypothetical protein Acsp05_56550 [Actinokineospora sp. NBRC 105648]